MSAADANAQNYPSRPIRLVVPQSAGGSTDLVARPLAQRVADGDSTALVRFPLFNRLVGPVLVDGVLAFDNFNPPGLGQEPFSGIAQFEAVAAADGRLIISTAPGTTTVSADANPYLCALAVTQITTETHPVGSLMYFRVRTVSSKGPGPWSTPIMPMV